MSTPETLCSGCGATVTEDENGTLRDLTGSKSCNIGACTAHYINIRPSVTLPPVAIAPEPQHTPLEKELIAVLKAYEQWEADLLLCHEAWGPEDTPHITAELWEKLLALQTMRNAAISRAEGGKQ